MSSHNELIEKLTQAVERSRQTYDYTLIMPFLREYRKAWETIKHDLGMDIAYQLAQLSRDDVIKQLRFTYKWSLQRIGNAFEMTGERVRQITRVSMRSIPACSEPNLDAIELILTLACRDREAWAENGMLKRSWLAEHLDPASLQELNLHSPMMSKFQLIMKYGLGLRTTQEQIDQMNEWQRGPDYKPYEEIARMLSSRFVSITVMTVYRGARKIGYKGHSTGAPGQPRHYEHLEGQE